MQTLDTSSVPSDYGLGISTSSELYGHGFLSSDGKKRGKKKGIKIHKSNHNVEARIRWPNKQSSLASHKPDVYVACADSS